MNRIKRTLQAVPSSAWAGIVLILFFAVVVNGYLGSRNILNILKSTSALVVVSAGMTMVILMGQIDMSVGGVITVSATAAGMYLQAADTVTVGTVLVAVLICCAIGTACGLFNGNMIGYKNFNYWLITFGSMSMAFGLAKGITNGGVLSGFDKKFLWISGGKMLGISMCIVWAILICAVALAVHYKTRFGFHIYAIGD
ncbi:MAG: ABC transporter permease [Clostridiales bacterium]|nr:ABC transporter permease [Clostridiales bacterium]